MNIIEVLNKENVGKIFIDDTEEKWKVVKCGNFNGLTLMNISDEWAGWVGRVIEDIIFLSEICKMDFKEE